MKRIWNNGMSLLLVLAMLLPMLGMAQPVMAAEGGTEAVTETDTDVTDTGDAEAAEQYEPRMEAAEAEDGSQDAETPIATAFTTYAEPQDDNQAAAAQDAQAGVQEANAAVVVPGRKGMVFSVRKAKRAASVVEDGYDDYDVSSKWSFDVQWRNEKGPYDMGTKTESFAPMYQVNFHSDLDTLRPGQIVIRMPASLYELTDEDGRKQGDRTGKLVLPSQVAVPKGTYVEGEAGTFVESAASPFNYDIVDNDHGSKDIVFWNYKDVPSGTTAAWQMTYPEQNLKAYSSTDSPSQSIIDGSKIKLTPSISIPDWTLTEVKQDADGNNVETTVHTGSISATGTPLTGLVDTYVRLSRVQVECKRITSESQLKEYIGEVPAEYSGENFSKYHYVRGYNYSYQSAGGSFGPSIYGTYVTGNQPCTLSFETTESHATGPDNTIVQGVALGNGVYAYLKTDLTAYPTCYVTGKVTCHPKDGLDEDTMANSTGRITIPKPSYWKYEGNLLNGKKDINTYMSSRPNLCWPAHYEENKSNGEDTVFAWYDVTSSFRGYGYTHDVNSEGLGPNEYKGGSFTLMTADDVLYAWSAKDTNNKIMLTADDYYMSSVSVNACITDCKIYEKDDGGTALGNNDLDLGNYSDRDLVIQAMFGGEGEDPDKWVNVAVVPWENATKRQGAYEAGAYRTGWGVRYLFTKSDLARQPYRVRAIQSCVDYHVAIVIDPRITIKQDSPAFDKLVNDKANITVENLAAVSIVAHPYDGEQLVIADYSQSSTYADRVRAKGYQTDLSAISEKLYGGDGAIFGAGWEYKAPMRPVQSQVVQPLNMNKYATTSQSVSTDNDTNRGRVSLRYSICGYEGFKITGTQEGHAPYSDAELLKKYASFPNRTEVKIYDLLPVGVHLDRDVDPTATYESHSVEVTDVVANYGNTGRELVEFTITCPYGLPKSLENYEQYDYYHPHYSYQQSAGINFTAYISWNDMLSLKIGPNIAAWIPSDGGPIIGKDTDVSLDDGMVVPGQYRSNNRWLFYPKADFTGPDGLSLLGSDINKDGITDTRSVLYSSSTATTNYVIAYEAGIDKKVRADAGGVATNAIQVEPGEDYTYDFIIKSRDNTSVKDVTVFDQIENVETNHWQGIFRGVGYDDAVAHGATGVTVWYNANREASMPDNQVTSSLMAENILTAEKGWFVMVVSSFPFSVRRRFARVRDVFRCWGISPSSLSLPPPPPPAGGRARPLCLRMSHAACRMHGSGTGGRRPHGRELRLRRPEAAGTPLV